MSATLTAPSPTVVIAAHESAPYVRLLPRRTPGAALLAEQVEAAYEERAQLLAEQVAREIDASGVTA